MREMLSTEQRQWADGAYSRLAEKLECQCRRIGDLIPYIPVEGHYQEDKGVTDVTGWINGFWGGMLWLMYHGTGKDLFRTAAEGVEAKLDRAFAEFKGLHHDVGFMWLLTAVADYRLTGDMRSMERGLHAATLLAGRPFE